MELLNYFNGDFSLLCTDLFTTEQTQNIFSSCNKNGILYNEEKGEINYSVVHGQIYNRVNNANSNPVCSGEEILTTKQNRNSVFVWAETILVQQRKRGEINYSVVHRQIYNREK